MNGNPRLENFKEDDVVLLQKPNYHRDAQIIYEGVIVKPAGGYCTTTVDLLCPDGTIERYIAWNEEIIIRVSD